MRKLLTVLVGGALACSSVSKLQKKLGVQPLKEYSLNVRTVAPEAVEFLGDGVDPVKEAGVKGYKTGISKYDRFFKGVAEARAEVAVGAALVDKAEDDLRSFVEERLSKEYAKEELERAKRVLKSEDDPSRWLKLLKRRLAEPEIKKLERIKEEAQLGVDLANKGSEGLTGAPEKAKKLLGSVKKDFTGKNALKAPNILEALKRVSKDASEDAELAGRAAGKGVRLLKALGEALKQ